MIYLIIFLIITVGIYKYDYRNGIQGKFVLWVFLCAVLIIVAGLRYRMGGDTIQYMFHFKGAHTLSNLKNYDFTDTRYAPGFVLLTSLSKTIYDDFAVLQFAVSIIVNIVIFRFLWLNTRHCYVGLMLYFLVLYTDLNMEVMREALAVSVFLLAWPFFRDGKWIFYYGMVLLSMLFHISAVFFLFVPLICLPGIKVFFRYGKQIYIIALLVLIIGFSVRYFLLDMLKYIAFTENMMERAENYSSDELGGLKSLNIGGIVSRIFRFVLYPMAAMYFLNKLYGKSLQNNRDYVKKERLTILSVYISLLSAGIMIFSRYNNYLQLFSFVIIADWVFTTLKFRLGNLRLRMIGWAIVFLPFFFFTMYSFYFHPINDAGNLKTYMLYEPYHSIVDRELDPNREKAFKYFRRH